MEDGEAAACMFAVLNMNYMPSEFAHLPQSEKAFVIACIENKVEAERKQAKKMEAQASKAKLKGGRH